MYFNNILFRALLDSGGPNPLGLERDEKIKEKVLLLINFKILIRITLNALWYLNVFDLLQIASSLKHMEVDQFFIDAAASVSIIF